MGSGEAHGLAHGLAHSCDWAGHARTCFIRNAPMVQQGMHIAAHTGTEMAVKKACTIGLRSWKKVTKGENSSGKQTLRTTVYTPKIRVATVYRPPNYGDLPTLHIFYQVLKKHVAFTRVASACARTGTLIP